jgi:hypothetical protein
MMVLVFYSQVCFGRRVYFNRSFYFSNVLPSTNTVNPSLTIYKLAADSTDWRHIGLVGDLG